MQLIWRGVSRYHDWLGDDRAIPRQMLRQARSADLIGQPDWISVGPDDEPQPVEGSQASLERLLDHRPKRGALFRIGAGGAHPSPWRMALGLFPFDAEEGQVRGYNILSLWLESKPFSGAAGSDALVQAFRTIHNLDNTESGYIHPYKRWSELSDPLGGHYEEPVTLGPLFRGVYWATFLGSNQLEFFEVDRLFDLKSFQVEWSGKESLFLRVSPDIAEAASPPVEKEMFRLTERFRSALR